MVRWRDRGRGGKGRGRKGGKERKWEGEEGLMDGREKKGGLMDGRKGKTEEGLYGTVKEITRLSWANDVLRYDMRVTLK